MKKGSKEAKAWGRKMQRARSGKTRIKSTGVKMAKRRRTVKRKTAKRRSPRKNNNELFGIVGGGMAYGALRQKISSLIAPVTAKIPGGIYADNLALGVVSYLAMKKGGKLPMGKYVKQVGKSGLTAESVLAGVDLGANLFNKVSVSNGYF